MAESPRKTVQPHRGLLGDGPRCLTAIHARLDRCRLTSKPPVVASAIYPAVYPFPAGWVAGVLALDVPDPHGGRLTVSPVGSDMADRRSPTPTVTLQQLGTRSWSLS